MAKAKPLIKTPSLELAASMADRSISAEPWTKKVVKEGLYTRDQLVHYFYVNYTLNLSTEGIHNFRKELERRQELEREACEAAAKIYNMTPGEIQKDYHLVIDTFKEAQAKLSRKKR